MEERLLQLKNPPEIREVLGIGNKTLKVAERFTRYFIANSMKQSEAPFLEAALSRKAVILEYARAKRPKAKRKSKEGKGKAEVLEYARKKRPTAKRKSKALSAGEKRRLKVFDIKPEHQRYELFLPLNDLWKQYILSICNGLRPSSNPQLIQQKLLKADFHGAILTVVRSKCPSYVGATGILVQEFKHIFKIITKEDRLKVIPKKNSVFAVEVNGFVSHIYGSKFQYRASERSVKKFKVKGSIDL
ncbi:ribonuclease P protein subunit p29 isoform X1 [Gadus morhua]|uniref:Ribonuclease P protein subunit p29 n=2 Tax=Gadus morhua TaxID=8049 RepID=A0A8C4YTR5_GADMO|nr:ribonuclease P protein subunit p29 isoform X1 [Gadus morhua]